MSDTHFRTLHNLHTLHSQIVDEIMEQRQGKVNEEFRYLDPKILRGNESGQVLYCVLCSASAVQCAVQCSAVQCSIVQYSAVQFHILTCTLPNVQVPRTKTPFSDAIVFVVGGGNYIEYQNLQVFNVGG